MRTGDTAKGAKKKADVAFSKLVRARGKCERCGQTDYSKLQCAHIRRRVYSATRVDFENAWALCYACHLCVDTDPVEFMKLVDKTIGQDKLEQLWAKAAAGVGKKVDWAKEAEILTLMLKAVASGQRVDHQVQVRQGRSAIKPSLSKRAGR